MWSCGVVECKIFDNSLLYVFYCKMGVRGKAQENNTSVNSVFKFVNEHCFILHKQMIPTTDSNNA